MATLEQRLAALEQVQHATAPTLVLSWIAATAATPAIAARPAVHSNGCTRGKQASKRRPAQKIVHSLTDPEVTGS